MKLEQIWPNHVPLFSCSRFWNPYWRWDGGGNQLRSALTLSLHYLSSISLLPSRATFRARERGRDFRLLLWLRSRPQHNGIFSCCMRISCLWIWYIISLTASFGCGSEIGECRGGWKSGLRNQRDMLICTWAQRILPKEGNIIYLCHRTVILSKCLWNIWCLWMVSIAPQNQFYQVQVDYFSLNIIVLAFYVYSVYI